MIEEQAQVVAVEGEFAWVETQRRSTCSSCAVNKGCGTATLAKIVGTRRARVRALNPVAAGVGEQVVIAIREDALLKGSVAVYLLPLLMMFVFAAAGQHISSSADTLGEGVVVVFGVLGLLFGFVWLRLFARSVKTDARFQPSILRRLS